LALMSVLGLVILTVAFYRLLNESHFTVFLLAGIIILIFNGVFESSPSILLFLLICQFISLKLLGVEPRKSQGFKLNIAFVGVIGCFFGFLFSLLRPVSEIKILGGSETVVFSNYPYFVVLLIFVICGLVIAADTGR
jgi:hypothetical protein